jgi:transposase
VHRQLTRLGHRCDVVAPALIPRKVGDRVKTDRRDAMMLAQTLRAGQLTAVWVPDEAHEAMRDLVRLRTQAMRDLRKARQQLLSFLLRHGRNSPYGHWTKMHRRWLGELVFAHPAQHLALEEMLQRIERAEALCDRLKAAILELVPQWSLAPVVQAIQALRGVSLIVAAAIVAEVGCFSRFESPRALMAYLGLNPSEHSSGATIRRGAITKTGNTLARTCLVEAAWTYRFPPRVSQIIRDRLKELPEPIRAVAWKAQVRLSARYRKLTAAGKPGPKVVWRSRASWSALSGRLPGWSNRSSPEPGKHSNALREVKQHQQDRLRRPMRTAGCGGRGTLDRGFVAGTIRRAFARQRKPHDEPWSCGTNPRIRTRSTVVHASCRPHWAPIQPSITCQSGTD